VDRRERKRTPLFDGHVEDSAVYVERPDVAVDHPVTRRLLATLTRHSQEWIVVLTPSGRYRASCGALEPLLGYTEQELFEHAFLFGIEPPFVDRISRAVMEIHAKPGASTVVEYRRIRKDGASVELRSTFVNRLRDPEIRGIVVTTSLAGGKKGVASRDTFVERLERTVAMQTHPYAVCIIDVRNLRQVSSALGQSAATLLTERIVRRLHSGVGPNDFIGHVGSQEFAVLFDGEEDEGRARALAERLQGRLRAPFRISGREVVINPSLGFVTNRRGYDNADEVLSDALSAAQRATGGRTRMFETEMRIENRRRLTLSAALPQAFERDELEAYYQPIVDLETGDVVGAEALVRWRHPNLGAISPAEFVPIAEATDWIITLDRWMIQRAALEAAEWEGDTKVSVNLSARHLEDPRLADTVRGALERASLPPERLRLELTETALASDVQSSIEALQRLRALGITLAIDDFGTGYASFGQLADFPFDVLKIDRSLVMRLDGDHKGRNVVPGVLSMAKQLGLVVVAEGIETEDQRRTLRDLGCELGQGWLFEKAVPNEALKALLAERRTY
jgi:PAS domain S-box-containing protein